jgi:DNA-binding MarR family transcriptional regulator
MCRIARLCNATLVQPLGESNDHPEPVPATAMTRPWNPGDKMTDVIASLPGSPPSALEPEIVPDSEIRLAQDLLFFAYRDFTNAADVILEELGLGRAHHRAMHFIGRHPGITVSELLSILRITKQSLARVLNELLERAYVAQTPGVGDRRQRLLNLTAAGSELERRLFDRQRAGLAEAFRAAGPEALAGFRLVMRGVMDESARAWVDQGLRDANIDQP